MIDILVIDNRSEFTNKLKLKLLSQLSITAIVKNNIQDAIEVIDTIPNITTIIGLDTLEEEAHIIQMLKVYAQSKNKGLSSFTYQKSDTDISILSTLSESLKIDFQKEDSQVLEYFNYHPIPLTQIEGLETPCDLYLKVGKDGHGQQFVKRVSAYDKVDEELFEKLISFSIENVYIHKDDYEIFFTSLSNLYSARLAQNGDIRLQAQYESYQYLVQYSNKLKIDKSLRELAENTIQSICNTILEQNSLSELINKVVSQKQDFAFQTFYLTNLVCSYLLKREGKLDAKLLYRLSFASLFCDLGLDNTGLFFINSQEDLDKAIEKMELNEDQITSVQNHAYENSKKLEGFKEIHESIIKTIRQHHGSHLGFGFNDRPTEEVTPMSKLFMASNTFIKDFLNPNYKFNKKQIIDNLTFRFANDALLRKYTQYLGQQID